MNSQKLMNKILNSQTFWLFLSLFLIGSKVPALIIAVSLYGCLMAPNKDFKQFVKWLFRL